MVRDVVGRDAVTSSTVAPRRHRAHRVRSAARHRLLARVSLDEAGRYIKALGIEKATFSWAYSPHVRGTSRPSKHSYGLAIDLMLFADKRTQMVADLERISREASVINISLTFSHVLKGPRIGTPRSSLLSDGPIENDLLLTVVGEPRHVGVCEPAPSRWFALAERSRRRVSNTPTRSYSRHPTVVRRPQSALAGRQMHLRRSTGGSSRRRRTRASAGWQGRSRRRSARICAESNVPDIGLGTRIARST